MGNGLCLDLCPNIHPLRRTHICEHPLRKSENRSRPPPTSSSSSAARAGQGGPLGKTLLLQPASADTLKEEEGEKRGQKEEEGGEALVSSSSIHSAWQEERSVHHRADGEREREREKDRPNTTTFSLPPEPARNEWTLSPSSFFFFFCSGRSEVDSSLGREEGFAGGGGGRRLLPVREAAFGIKAGTTDTLVRSSSSSTDVCVYTVFRQEKGRRNRVRESGDRLLFRFPQS